MTSNRLLYHAMALITVVVWGVTFVSTKVLITDGLDPAQIFVIRFAVAYLCTLLISHNRFRASNIKDELLMLVAGITGGSLYFISENTALSLTFAANVSLIICCAPILTMILGKILFNDLIKPMAWIGTIIAFTGVGIVVFNSSDKYGINPWGDVLTFVAALSWAVYCLLLKTLSRRYSNLFITRKVFGYGGNYCYAVLHTDQRYTWIYCHRSNNRKSAFSQSRSVICLLSHVECFGKEPWCRKNIRLYLYRSSCHDTCLYDDSRRTGDDYNSPWDNINPGWRVHDNDVNTTSMRLFCNFP